MRYIIMCGGRYGAWEHPRQLTEVCGEAVVERTIRLLRENGIKEIYISSNDDRFLRFGVPVLRHFNDFNTEGRGCWADAFFPTEEPVTYLFGDVVYSPYAISKILFTPTTGIEFFASAPPFSPLYIKPWAEPFAFKVMDQKRFRKAIDFVKANEKTGIFNRRPIAWELWQVITGCPLNYIDYSSYTVINDYTCDIDQKEDAQKIESIIRRLT